VNRVETSVIGFLAGIVGGFLGAIATDFVRKPFREFFTLRREIRHELLRLANVVPPDPKPTYPTYSRDEIDRLQRPIREAEDTLRSLGTRMMSFAETELIAVNCVRLLRFAPLDAGIGLVGLSNTFEQKGSGEWAAHRMRVNKALRLPM
jgi:hypothetical protein